MKYVLHLAAKQLPDPLMAVALTRGCFCPHLRHTADTGVGTVLQTGDSEIRASVNIKHKSFTHDLMKQQIRGLVTTRLETIQTPTIHPTPGPLLQNYLRFCRRANTRKGYFEL